MERPSPRHRHLRQGTRASKSGSQRRSRARASHPRLVAYLNASSTRCERRQRAFAGGEFSGDAGTLQTPIGNIAMGPVARENHDSWYTSLVPDDRLLQTLQRRRRGARGCSTSLANNWDALTNYGWRHRNGFPISSSRAEGCVDDIGNARMGKRRRMRWSPKGAHRVAVTRAAVLDGRLTVSHRKLAV